MAAPLRRRVRLVKELIFHHFGRARPAVGNQTDGACSMAAQRFYFVPKVLTGML
jgi:hypothetical protein